MSLPICPCAERSSALSEGLGAPYAVWRIRLQRESGLSVPDESLACSALEERERCCLRGTARASAPKSVSEQVRALSPFRGRVFRDSHWLPLEGSGEREKKVSRGQKNFGAYLPPLLRLVCEGGGGCLARARCEASRNLSD